MLLAVHLILTAGFAGLGILFSRGKGAFLIAGYNTASKAEQWNTDEKALCKCMGKLMFALAGCFLLVAASDIFKLVFLLWLGLGLFFAVTIAGVIYMNTGNRFQKKP